MCVFLRQLSYSERFKECKTLAKTVTGNIQCIIICFKYHALLHGAPFFSVAFEVSRNCIPIITLRALFRLFRLYRLGQFRSRIVNETS